MDLLLTRTFLAVAETGSITQAAERLGVTQSALSRRIQQYEAQLDSQLLSRGRKGVELTETGKLAAAEGQRLLASFNKLREEIALQQGLQGGSVRIGGGATTVSFILPPAIAAFQQAHPNIRFQLKEAGSAEIAEDVVSGRLELGIVTLPLSRGTAELQVQPLRQDQIVLVCRSSHPFALRERVPPETLKGQPFVSFEAGTTLRKLIDESVSTVQVTLNTVMELRSIPAILRMVETTGNLAFVSRMSVEDHPRIRVVPVDGLTIQLSA